MRCCSRYRPGSRGLLLHRLRLQQLAQPPQDVLQAHRGHSQLGCVLLLPPVAMTQVSGRDSWSSALTGSSCCPQKRVSAQWCVLQLYPRLQLQLHAGSLKCHKSYSHLLSPLMWGACQFTVGAQIMAWQVSWCAHASLSHTQSMQQGLLIAPISHLHICAELAVLPARGVICDALQAWRHQLLWRDSLRCLRGCLCHGCRAAPSSADAVWSVVSSLPQLTSLPPGILYIWKMRRGSACTTAEAMPPAAPCSFIVFCWGADQAQDTHASVHTVMCALHLTAPTSGS